ncbi:hypothetical protein D9615_009495 [Tricholomella constricta]|uniref:Uncharacterized protein n=1 Tax=Tricholomella constricta TaxID=117010 RepID=A0A8H5GYJ4_9AGAR|nr:hypothetical protein D9615_009495 [Tricholomella constricta]
METKRAQTLEALEAFIRSQRALLARTQSDITRLEHLKSDATSRPTHFMENLDDEFKESTFRLSDQCDAQLALPPNIDWTVYEAHDPSALQSLTSNARQKYEQRNKPCLYQRSELSELQKFVKDARRTIVDPVLAIFECMSEPEEEPEEKLDPEEARREREREKLRQLKKRKIQTWGGLKLPSAHARGLSGVFIRHDVEDESLEVDVTLEDRRDCTSTPPASAMDVDTPSTSVITASSTSRPATERPPSVSKLPRSRRPSNKAQYQSEKKAKSASIPAKRKAKVSAPAEHEPLREAAAAASKPRGADKPKPETYKQAWSVSEQHLLEQLLEQIPEGEKNRWQKISRAMNGRRTPRQVASRVQKYFEKLKRFGVEDG